MRRRRVVTCFLWPEGRILLLRRSVQVQTHREKWAGVSGGIEESTPVAQAMREIREETGLEEHDVRLERRGEPLVVPDSEYRVEWTVYPFLFEVRDLSLVRLNLERTEGLWVAPEDIRDFDVVPMLGETWERLWRI